MIYRLSLHDRTRLARNKRDRYQRDEVYRLEQINAVRARRNQPPHKSLDDARLRVAR